MPIPVKCACGKTLSLKDELAGKKVKCPACQKLLSVPTPKVPEESPDEPWNLDDSDFEDESEEAPAKSRSSKKSASSGAKPRKGKAKGKKSSGNQRGLLIGLAAGGGLLVAALLTWMFWPAKPADNVAANPPGDAPAKVAAPTSGAGTSATPAATGSAPGGGAVGNVVGSSPRLPDAVTQAPAWLVGNAPFDVVKYFEAPPPDQNAAPLYLDAIAEFSWELENCFPADPQQTQRFQAVKERVQRYMALQDKPRTEATAAQWDALLRDYEVGFQKLAIAQQKPKCVFETGVGIMALWPHVQSARGVARMVDERVRRDLENGNFDRPLQSIEICLRLSRDIRQRGLGISQLVSTAMDGLILEAMVRRLITTPGVKREHCDRLLVLLQEHEQQSQNLHLDSAQGEYISQRAALHDIQDPAARRAIQQSMGLKDDSIGAIWMVITELAFTSDNPSKATATDIPKANERAAKLDERQEIAAFDEEYRTVVALGQKPYRERAAGWSLYETTFKETANREMKLLIAPALMTGWGPMFEALTRGATKRHGAQALVALRRWQLTHTEPPRDLAQVMSDAGVNAVPRDDYADAPLKLATLNGQPLIYSIGGDGKDDGGAVEFQPQSGPKGPGDVLFQLTPPQ